MAVFPKGDSYKSSSDCATLLKERIESAPDVLQTFGYIAYKVSVTEILYLVEYEIQINWRRVQESEIGLILREILFP